MGPMGQMGQMGPAGLNGPAGAQGLQGAAGAAGPAGAMGPAGPAGATGAAGPAGAAGPMGPLGATGAPGVAGPQGLQGLQGLAGPTGAAGGFTVVAANGNTLGTVLSFGTSGQPSLVALQNNGVWLAAPVNPDGIVPMSFYALYADDACATPPFLPFDTNPAPFFRLLQTVNPGDTAGFYAGNAAQVQTFRSLSVIGQPGQCLPTAGSGWDLPLLAGPMRRVDLATVPAPFVVR